MIILKWMFLNHFGVNVNDPYMSKLRNQLGNIPSSSLSDCLKELEIDGYSERNDMRMGRFGGITQKGYTKLLDLIPRYLP